MVLYVNHISIKLGEKMQISHERRATSKQNGLFPDIKTYVHHLSLTV